MKYRVARHLFAALLLGTFVILALGTSYIEKEELGDHPLAMTIHEDRAYLLYYSTGPHSDEQSPDMELIFAAIGRDGKVAVLQEGDVPAINHRTATAAVTATAEAAVSFLVAEREGRAFAVAAMEPWASPQVTWFDEYGTPPLSYPRALSIMQVDAHRYWVFFQQAYWNPEHQILPLFDLQDGIPTLVAHDVLWADCSGALCQQLRYEDTMLRLYTDADAYAEPVTETEAVGHHYYPGRMENGGPALFFGNDVYALSTTTPILTELGDRIRKVQPIRSQLAEGSFTKRFADGGRIRVAQKTQSSPGRRFCDRDCRKTHEVKEINISLYDADGRLEHSIVLNDYEAGFFGF